jgi:hypothetical protein
MRSQAFGVLRLARPGLGITSGAGYATKTQAHGHSPFHGCSYV